MRKDNEQNRKAKAAKKEINDGDGNSANENDRNRKMTSKPMAKTDIGERINDLIDAEKWKAAQAFIHREIEKAPDDHWLITRLGETFYEQRDYKTALEYFLRSRDIVPDCPLTLWHLAGTLDALGDHDGAVKLYLWLLQSNKTPTADACWESKEWTESLKADCVYRLGLCFKHQNKKQKAEKCFRQYIALQITKPRGSYPIEDASRNIEGLGLRREKEYKNELKKLLEVINGQQGKLEDHPTLNHRRIQKLQQA